MDHLHDTCLPAALAKACEANAALQKKLDDGNRTGGDGSAAAAQPEPAVIPRPKGTAGKDFTIQIAMGLSGVGKKDDNYKCIQVSESFRDAVKS